MIALLGSKIHFIYITKADKQNKILRLIYYNINNCKINGKRSNLFSLKKSQTLRNSSNSLKATKPPRMLKQKPPRKVSLIIT